MCEPNAMMALSMGSQFLEQGSQGRQARAQAQATVRSLDHQIEGLRRRQRETDQDADREILERRRQQMRHEGKLRAAFGDAGVVGLSPQREIHQTRQRYAEDAGTVDMQRRRAHTQTRAEAAVAGREAEDRITSMRQAIPHPVVSSLMIGTSGLEGYMTGRTLERNL